MVKDGQSMRIHGPMLKAKAEELTWRLSTTDFVAADGWFPCAIS